MGGGINSEALWPGDRCDLAGAPFRGIGISEESEKIHKAGTPSLKKRFVEGKNMFLLDSWFYVQICFMICSCWFHRFSVNMSCCWRQLVDSQSHLYYILTTNRNKTSLKVPSPKNSAKSDGTPKDSFLVIGHKIGPGPPSFPTNQCRQVLDGVLLRIHGLSALLLKPPLSIPQMELEAPWMPMHISGGLEFLKEYIVENIGMWWDSHGKLWDFMGFVEISGSFIEHI